MSLYLGSNRILMNALTIEGIKLYTFDYAVTGSSSLWNYTINADLSNLTEDELYSSKFYFYSEDNPEVHYYASYYINIKNSSMTRFTISFSNRLDSNYPTAGDHIVAKCPWLNEGTITLTH